jgi:biopolymer transport protein ExbD
MNETPLTFRWRTVSVRPLQRAGWLNRGLVAAAPWLDAGLLVIFFLIVASRVVIQPGIRLTLPEAPFRDGVNPYDSLVAVVVAGGPAETPGGIREVVYFDEERFFLSRPDHVKKLQAAWSRAVRQSPSRPLLLQADPAVTQGTLTLLLKTAAEAGFREALIATRPSESLAW